MLKSLAERFVADRHRAPSRAADPDGRSDHAARNWRLLAETGLLGLPFAEDVGGAGGGEEEVALVMEAFGRGLSGGAYFDEIVVAGRLMQVAGTQAQRGAWLPGLIAGTRHLALAHAEHASRFDLAACRTRFEDGRLTGAKTHVPDGADALIVTACTSQGPGLFLVHTNAPRLEARRYRLVDGASACELTLDGVEAEPLEGGLATLQHVAEAARVAACAEMLGLMSLLLDDTLDHVRARQQFGAPIGSFQAVQHRLADLYVSSELSRSLLYRCILAEAPERAASVAAAKSFVSTAAVRLGEECIQFHGGMGVSDDLAVGHAHKRILLLASAFGTADTELGRYNRELAALA